MTDHKQMPAVAIVDALSTGQYFAPHLKKRGYQCVHVLSNPKIAGSLQEAFHPQYFIENIKYDGNLETVVSALKKYNLVLVIPGAETGVLLADSLSRRLKLPSNDTALSLARRNKYMMQENLRARGLRAIKEKYAVNLSELLSWAEEQKTWPIVLKPVEDAGTEGVNFCNNLEELKNAFHSIMHHINSLGIENTSVLAQERVTGTECIVNTVSFEDKHYITDHWQYRKIVVGNSFPIYDYARLMPHPINHNHELVKYDASVLDALGFTNGPSHGELMLTDTGPVLIEVGARLMGASMPPEIVSECIGHNQLDLTLDCFLNPQHFLKKVERPYQLFKHCMIKFLISYQEGTVKAIPGRSIIEKLPSARVIRVNPKVGGAIPKTIDLFTSPGEVILVHQDPAVLEADYQKICDLEKEGLFEIYS
ncbi:MAG: ATP-grasp domain-containing protein [Candidatus Saganbacteria bacterium]|nr:ATP-grasp domain-containing protein [Candidatus Saganbacteria bacterium]